MATGSGVRIMSGTMTSATVSVLTWDFGHRSDEWLIRRSLPNARPRPEVGAKRAVFSDADNAGRDAARVDPLDAGDPASPLGAANGPGSLLPGLVPSSRTS